MKFSAFFAFVISALFITTAAHAGTWDHCKADIEKFCKDKKGDEDTYKCLQEHDKDLSADCEKDHAAYEKATGKK